MRNGKLSNAAVRGCVALLLILFGTGICNSDIVSRDSVASTASLAGETNNIKAAVSKQSIYFDGKPCDISAYNIDNSNYFGLRDLAALLSGSTVQFSITTRAEDYSILIDTSTAYTPRGDEMSPLSESVTSIAPSKWKLVVNGKTAPVAAYNIDGSNFYKLRDLGDAIGFGVEYDAVNKSVQITSAFSPDIPAGAAVDPSWFNDALFAGDSVSSWLTYYSGDKGLGQAKFMIATSFGIENALSPVTASSVHPSYQGTKMTIEDAVVKSGAKKVYLMFGLNDIGYGIDKATTDYVKLVNNILAKAPDTQIYIQSVTPLANGSQRADNILNNTTINTFNAKMKEYCQANHWYYMDVASVYRDEGGFLKREFCGDFPNMGLHLTYAATSDWVNYLRTHAK